MDINIVLSAISTVGFPIVCCIGLFWFANKNLETHKEEIAKITEALNNNTIALTKLMERIDKDV